MNILKALSKQLFGAKYERVIKSLAACLILFLAIHTAGISMEIAACCPFPDSYGFFGGHHVAGASFLGECGSHGRAVYAAICKQGNDLFDCAGICRIYNDYKNISGAGFIFCRA